MEMKDVYFESGIPCNFCFNHKSTDGISWLAGEKPNGMKIFYHVCDKCAEIFRKRSIGTSKQLSFSDKYNEAIYKREKNLERQGIITREIEAQQDTRHTKRHKEMYVIFPDIVKQFSDDDEDWLAAYGWVVKEEKEKTKRIKGQQTYVRNRLNDEKTIQKLIDNGFVSTDYFGLIKLKDIESWCIWNEEEREKIEEIARMRQKKLEEQENEKDE